AIGGSTGFDNVKPFGFQDPDSESARAYDTLKEATGQRALPEAELLIEPRHAGLVEASARAAHRLRRIDGIPGVVTRALDGRRVPRDGQAAVVLGFISSDVSDSSEVGADVRERFSGDASVTVGGAAATVDELTRTTQDDLQRIELFALPLLLLLSLLVFRGLVAALLPVVVGGLSIL